METNDAGLPRRWKAIARDSGGNEDALYGLRYNAAIAASPAAKKRIRQHPAHSRDKEKSMDVGDERELRSLSF